MNFLVLAFILVGLTAVSLAQPHPYPMGFTVFASSSCPDNRHCTMRKIDACMELDYYPLVCDSRNITTVVEGNCSQAGTYANNTIVTLRALNNELPFEGFLVNFNSSNPMLPIVKNGGMESGGDRMSVIVDTDGGCKTNITVLAGLVLRHEHGLEDLDCDEELLVHRCH